MTVTPHLAFLPRWLAGVVVLLFAWRIWLTAQRRASPPRWLLTPIMLAVTVGIALEFRTLAGQDAGIALLALLMGGKLLELRAPRDGHVLVMLGLFLLLTHYFNAESLLVGAWMFGALILLLATMSLAQSPTLPPRQAFATAARMIVLALPLMLVLFVLFPRITGPLWGLPQSSAKALSGLSEEMSPGSISELIQSPALAFRVRFDGSPPERDRLYWRGPVLTDFDGRNWRRTPTAALATRTPPTVSFDPGAPAIGYEMTLEAHQQRWLLPLEFPRQLDLEHVVSRDLTALRRQPLRERLRYHAVAGGRYQAGADESPEVLARAHDLPPGNPRTRALAASWRAIDPAPAALIARALAHFDSDAFAYTLRPPTLPETDGIDTFLFDTRRGFCEHYAGSFVVLMRAAGVPARVVAGYQGGEINPIDGDLTVRQSDAHAWAEVWLAGEGWVRVDPTAAVAPSRIDQGLSAALAADEPLPAMMRGDFTWLRALRHRWEALNSSWNRWVLGYNADQQQRLLALLGLPVDWRALIGLLAGLGGAILLAMAFWLLRQRAEHDPAVRAWRRFTTRLARLGVPRQDWEGPRSLARRASRELPALAEPIRTAAAAFERLHYARPQPDDLQTLKRCLQQLPWRT